MWIQGWSPLWYTCALVLGTDFLRHSVIIVSDRSGQIYSPEEEEMQLVYTENLNNW